MKDAEDKNDEIVLKDGSIPIDSKTVLVDCTAGGLTNSSPRAIFEDDRITLQSVFLCS